MFICHWKHKSTILKLVFTTVFIATRPFWDIFVTLKFLFCYLVQTESHTPAVTAALFQPQNAHVRQGCRSNYLSEGGVAEEILSLCLSVEQCIVFGYILLQTHRKLMCCIWLTKDLFQGWRCNENSSITGSAFQSR